MIKSLFALSAFALFSTSALADQAVHNGSCTAREKARGCYTQRTNNSLIVPWHNYTCFCPASRDTGGAGSDEIEETQEEVAE